MPLPSVTTFLFSFKKVTIRLAFCVTINKTQVRTLCHTGIYLFQLVFRHEQLYVAMPRLCSYKNWNVQIQSKSGTINRV